MATVAEIKAATERVTRDYTRRGCWNLCPPVELVDRRGGQVVKAHKMDIDGEYPQHVHIEGRGGWFPNNFFDVKPK